MKNNLIDRQERMAALDTESSHHVESPAGSGKTLLLTSRFLRLLGEVNNPREILALTFTEKAAGEMKARIINYLVRAKAGDTPRDTLDGELLASAGKAIQKHRKSIHYITSSNGLNITTFHGFCNYIARRAPVEAGVAPDYEIMDENTTFIMADEAIERFRKRSFSYPPGNIKRDALENRLLRLNNSWKSLSEELKEIIKNRDQFEDLIKFISEAGNRGLASIPDILNKRLRIYIERCLDKLRESFINHDPGAGWEDFIHHLSSEEAGIATELPSSVPDPSWEALPLWQAIAEAFLTQKGSPRKSFGPKGGYYSNFKKTVWGKAITEMEQDLAERLHNTRLYPALNDAEMDVDILSYFIIVAADVIKEYEGLCREKHLLDFIGLEQSALRALDENNPSDIYLHLDHRIRHLLMDEFQDTNRIQWDLIQRLCAGWFPDDGRTVFIVGDPKQSIYAFRNAEVGLFYETKSGIPLSGQGVLPLLNHTLKTNFRSSKSLIAWTNELFGKTVMVNPDADADEVPFSPSAPSDRHGEGSPLSLNLFHDKDNEKAKDDEATWLARKVKLTLEETNREKSIAILLFTRNRLARYLKALKEEGVPVQVQEGLGLTKRPEVMHLIQMARLITMPHDDIAWASLLRSPWSWFDIRTLLETKEQGPESWREKIRLMSEINPEMKVLEQALDGAFRRAGRDSLGKVVKKLWEDLEGPVKTARLYGMAGVANCDKFFTILEEMEQGIPQETLRRFETAMETLYEPADPTMARSSVQMMTIHRAKGLEFDTVFIPYLDWKPLASGPANPPPYLLERVPGTDGKHVIAMGRDRRIEESSNIDGLLGKLAKDRKWGEAKRWFYVASTRAISSLILSGVVKIKDGTISAPEKSILKWVFDHESINGKNPDDISVETERTASININPFISASSQTISGPKKPLPEPYILSMETPPYIMESPSSLASEIAGNSYKSGERFSEVSFEAVMGTVIHRILNTFIARKRLPSETAVARTLFKEGMARIPAREMAPKILKEVEATLKDPFIAGLTDKSQPIVKTEWAIEDMPKEKHIRSGIIDLAVFDGSTWWIVDFKTSRPKADEPIEYFLQHEEELYRPQIDTYRSMLNNLKHGDKIKIRSGIYLTALQIWREINSS